MGYILGPVTSTPLMIAGTESICFNIVNAMVADALDISIYDIGYVEQVSTSLTRGMIWKTCAMSNWS